MKSQFTAAEFLYKKNLPVHHLPVGSCMKCMCLGVCALIGGEH